MSDLPAVLVLSIGRITPAEIIANITKDNDPQPEILDSVYGSQHYEQHLHKIKTKYYETVVALTPYNSTTISSISAELLKCVEVLVIFFDAADKSILQMIPSLNTFLETHEIEIGLLLTDKLNTESAKGPMFADIKSACSNSLDIIELYSDTANEILSYDEVQQVFYNHVWANVSVAQKRVGQEATTSNNTEGRSCMEEQLDTFENLLMYVENFKRVSSNMERDQILDEAEKIAQLFDNILNEK